MPISSSIASSTEHWTRTPGERDGRADRDRDRVGRRVGEHRDGGLDLAEAVRRGRRGVGRQQQRVVEAVGHVRLVARRPPGPQLGHRHRELGRPQQRDDPGQLGRRRTGDQPDHLGARARPGRRTAARRRRRRAPSPPPRRRGRCRGWRSSASRASKSSAARPSISTTRPSRTTSDGSGSCGLAIATRPSPTSSCAKPSRLTRCWSMNRMRPTRLIGHGAHPSRRRTRSLRKDSKTAMAGPRARRRPPRRCRR